MAVRHHFNAPRGISSLAANARIDAFLAEIVEVCRKHGLSLSHEDRHGCFEVERLDDDFIEWLNDARVGESLPWPERKPSLCDSSAS